MHNSKLVFDRMSKFMFPEDLTSDIFISDGAEDDETHILYGRSKAIHKDNYLKGLISISQSEWKCSAINRLIGLCEDSNVSQTINSCLFDAVLFSDRYKFTEREDGHDEHWQYGVVDYIKNAPLIFNEEFFEKASDQDLVSIMKTMNDFYDLAYLMTDDAKLTADEIVKLSRSIQYIEENHVWHLGTALAESIRYRSLSIDTVMAKFDYLWSDNAINMIQQEKARYISGLRDYAVGLIYRDITNQVRTENPGYSVSELRTAMGLYDVCIKLNIDGMGSWNYVANRNAVLFTITSKDDSNNDVLSCMLAEYDGNDFQELRFTQNFHKDMSSDVIRAGHEAVGKSIEDKINALGIDVFFTRQGEKDVIDYSKSRMEESMSM